MRIVVYSRVSTQDQETDNQTVVLSAWASQREFKTVGYYTEQESAWKAGQQQELARLVEDARKRKFEAVLVWSLDRLSREGALAILSLVHRLNSYGVKVLSYQESWTEAPGELAELLYALTGWIARMESQRRSERTKAALSRLKVLGRRLGRPPGIKEKRKRKQKRKTKQGNNDTDRNVRSKSRLTLTPGNL